MTFSSPVAITEFSKFGDLLSAISQVALVLKNLPANVGYMGLISAFSKPSLNTWKFMVHILLKPGLENFELLC